jgi:hypothetical protein
MVRNSSSWALTTLILLGFVLSSACGDSLVDVCEEAQDNQCTTISGDCSAFVDALDRISSAAACSSEYDQYESCATGQSDVCTIDSACSGKETALGICIAPYCLANSAECAAIQDVF